MGSEFDETKEPKDNTKLIWGVLVAAFVVMAAVIWFWSRPAESVSQVRFRHILITFKVGDDADRARALELITQIRDRIVKGESWATLAKTYSNDPLTADRGGDMGWVTKGQLDSVVEAYVWDAPVKQLSDIVQSARGFHIIEVTGLVLSKADQYNQDLKRREEEKLKQERSAPAKDAGKPPSSPAAPAAPAQ